MTVNENLNIHLPAHLNIKVMINSIHFKPLIDTIWAEFLKHFIFFQVLKRCCFQTHMGNDRKVVMTLKQ